MKYVYSFNEGHKDMRNILGGKGANLCEMTNLGLPIPKGFIVTTEACNNYQINKKLDKEIENQIFTKLKELEVKTNKKFGDSKKPLLVSVRSGARSSMPGMMDTILNLGLNDEITNELSKTMDPKFVYDAYRRFIYMYSDVVKGLKKENFDKILDKKKEERKVKLDQELNENDLKEIVNSYKEEYKKETKEDFPQDIKETLLEAIKAVFDSWNNERAIYYRKINNIPDNWGTAVNIQEMVYGNLNNNSLTGVVFSRNPSNGENELFGEFLINAQGEDIVSGARTPEDISKLKEIMPKNYIQLFGICKKLEKHYKDMQDMEFTIEDGNLYMLQTRNGKRTGNAHIKILVDLVKEKIITEKEAVLNSDINLIENLLHKVFDEKDIKSNKPIEKGINASPGAGVGKVYFTSKDIEEQSKKGEKNLILMRMETSAEDIKGAALSNALVTSAGGMTSHAAVVARGMGIPCVSGCSNIKIDIKNKKCKINDIVINEGDIISVDGTNGNIYLGNLKMIDSNKNSDLSTFMEYVKKYEKIKVRANADTIEDVKKSLSFGAEGIGLCRTEHMFFEKSRIYSFRKMIFGDKQSLKEVKKYQKDDFLKILKQLKGMPLTVRLLDPPLHEFLPKEKEEIKELAKGLNITEKALKDKIEDLKEVNPMMGNRGCRLLITNPLITKIEAQAIGEAIVKVEKEKIKTNVEVMIPLIGDKNELKYLRNIVKEEIDKILEKNNIRASYKIGTMLEVPRSILTINEINEYADFFSFGTNDLTQMIYGYSRDDIKKFMPAYLEEKILENNPFEVLDQKGVGSLIKYAIKEVKKKNPNKEFGICGEQGAELSGIIYLSSIDADYVSCSAYRVLGARVASAKANILNERR